MFGVESYGEIYMTTDADKLNNQLMQVDAGYWAAAWGVRLQASKFSFKNHEYQMEPMSSTARRRCYMKATQGGWTEIEVLRSLHAMIYGHHPQGDLYMFPTTDDVQEFSKSRFNPLIVANKNAIGKYVKSGGKGTDTASLKKINEAFLYLRGARLSQKVSDQNESSKMRGIPVDSVKFDELDLMDESVIAKARGRMGHSMVKEEVYLSNPLVPGEGIDKIFATSDQRYWWRRCRHCTGVVSTAVATTSSGTWTCAEKFFIEDPERCVGKDKDGKGYIACRNCGRPVPIYFGIGSAEWRADLPSNSDFMHGYQHSQLTSVYNDPLEILDAFRNPPEGNLADVYRLRLGLPYIAAEDRLTRAQVQECCTPHPMPHSHSGPCAMGVDVGKIKHIVIGPKTGKDQYENVKMARLSKWDDILDMAVKFNVKMAIVDIRPYEDSAREFQKNAKKLGIKVYLCEYKENATNDYAYNDHTGIVAANRTQIFDATHRLITEQRLVIPRRDEEVDEYTKQMCGAYKILETNKKTGTSVYRYKGKNEHYRNAQNYHFLAANKSNMPRVKSNRKRQTSAKIKVRNGR